MSAAAVEATLGLGGNLGDVTDAFAGALKRLSQADGVKLLRLSSVYRTPPWGVTDQPDFLNMAALVSTRLTPRALLELCLTLERDAGRERIQRWGPRTLDIDVLTYGDITMAEPDLTIPHPRIAERAFVLIPLAEVAPGLKVSRETIAHLANNIDCTGVKRDEIATDRLVKSMQSET